MKITIDTNAITNALKSSPETKLAKERLAQAKKAASEHLKAAKERGNRLIQEAENKLPPSKREQLVNEAKSRTARALHRLADRLS